MKPMLFGALVMLCAGIAHATNPSKFQYMAYGSGTKSCGTYDSESDNSAGKLIGVAWALGYLTGMNQWSRADKIPIAKTDANAVQYWLDNYCHAHPLEHFGLAVYRLTNTLILRGYHLK